MHIYNSGESDFCVMCNFKSMLFVCHGVVLSSAHSMSGYLFNLASFVKSKLLQDRFPTSLCYTWLLLSQSSVLCLICPFQSPPNSAPAVIFLFWPTNTFVVYNQILFSFSFLNTHSLLKSTCDLTSLRLSNKYF